MVFRFCLCPRKYPILPPLYRLKPSCRSFKYPGALLQPSFNRQLNTKAIDQISHQLEKIELTPKSSSSSSSSSPSSSSPPPSLSFIKSSDYQELDQILKNSYSSKQARIWYSHIAKWPPKGIVYLFSTKLKEMEYNKKLRSVFLEAASYWSIDTIHSIMSMWGRQYTQLRLDLFNSILLPRYVITRDISSIIYAIPQKGKLTDILPFYNTALSQCQRNKEYNHMEFILDLMKERGVPFDTATFNILIRMKLSSYNEKSQDDMDGLNLYHNLLKEGFIPSQATFNIFIRHSIQYRQWHILKRWLDLMEDHHLPPNVVTLRILFRAMTKYPNEEDVCKAFEHVANRVPLITEKEKLLNAGITSLLENNENEAAMDVLNKVFRLDEPPSIYAYNLLLRALCQDSRIDDAQRVLDTMMMSSDSNIPKPDIVSFTTVIHGFVRKSEGLEEVEALYESLLQQDLHTNNVLQSVIMYALIRASASENYKDLTKIKTMFESIIARNHQTRTPFQHGNKALSEMTVYNMMIDFYFLHYHHSERLRDRIPQEPFRLLEEAIERKKLKPNLTTLNIMVRGLAILNKDLNLAEKMVEWLKEKGVNMDERTVWYLAKTAYRQGQLSRACQWIDAYDSLGQPIKGSGLIRLKSKLKKDTIDEKEEI
ncbi:uncharacterized protein BX663DRAFT_493085 [Cokeromyces recurvatus]|uniref:uncharacterized protein n=1 Tax=Cokeromyces recurvatus TaxID=90255 RepID=UPI00221E8380|nr:uncharacterized protein BX663DRAFT_493085 [Cokeromyces recurvatus]KAI7908133.1 hypothetical protein BX663DRAFT_493085 [Cokeromyces recurvatus]